MTPQLGDRQDDRSGALLRPPCLFTAGEVLAKPSPVPRSPGVYAWYFDEVPPSVPVDGCHNAFDHWLLYVGIAPKAPPAGGGKASATDLHQRISYHFTGNAEGSTLRLTLGCLLADQLGIRLRRVGNGGTKTFTNPGEQRLDAWMAGHAKVAWVATQEPWVLEAQLIESLSLPLNLAGNRHPFCATLKTIRGQAAAMAASMPVADRGGPRRPGAGPP